jgi:hypothetical protein
MSGGFFSGRESAATPKWPEYAETLSGGDLSRSARPLVVQLKMRIFINQPTSQLLKPRIEEKVAKMWR